MSGATQIYYGEGKGKTTAALGLSIREAGCGKSVIIVQFLKGRDCKELDLLKRLEPEVKLFRFEKANGSYFNLTNEEREEECMNIRNGLNYVRKVLTTGQCDILVIDEMLGLVEYGILTVEEIHELLSGKNDEMALILTGRTLPKGIEDLADDIYRIEIEKES
jgi:cob(I)alamin adenosyltransferase